MEDLSGKSTEDIIHLYSMAIKELKKREIIRTNNVVGELGKYLCTIIYER